MPGWLTPKKWIGWVPVQELCPIASLLFLSLGPWFSMSCPAEESFMLPVAAVISLFVLLLAEVPLGAQVPAGSLEGSACPPLFRSRIYFFHLAKHRGQGPTSHFLAIIGNYKALKQRPTCVSPLSSSSPSHHLLFSKTSSLFLHPEETQPMGGTPRGAVLQRE